MITKVFLSNALIFSTLAVIASSFTLNSNLNDLPSTFSLSQEELIKNAQSIEKALGNKQSTDTGKFSYGSYSSVGWSNRIGTVLTPASIPGVYTADRPFIWNNIDVGGKMTVIQLKKSSSSSDESNELFIHSPVFLDPPLIKALEELGTVKHVVSPNYEHVKYAKQWGEYFTDACIWGCPGIMEKEPLVNWTGEIPKGCRPPGYDFSLSSTTPAEGMWDWNEIQPIHIDCERLPILKTPFFSEVIFFHAPSKSLLVTDSYWNYPRKDGKTNADYDELARSLNLSNSDFGVWELAPDVGTISFGSRSWKFGMDVVYRPIYLKLLVEKKPFQNLMEFVCENLDIHTVIPAHGDIVRGKEMIRTILREHFALGSKNN